MKEKIKQIIIHPVFSSSLLMILGSNLVNFINYIYHLAMGRLLGPVNYGELASLISLIGIIGMVPFSFGLVITKFTSSAKNELETKKLISWFNKSSFVISITIFLVTVAGSQVIAGFLNIKNPLLLSLVGATFIFSFPSFIYRSSLQGLLEFKQMLVSIIGETMLKLIIGSVLVYLGFSLMGAIWGFVIATIVGWVLARLFIKKYLINVSGNMEINIRPMLAYSLPVFFLSLAQTSLYSSDIMLVKHFFLPRDAGIYAAMSTLGRIILFASGPIGAVMFPMISQRHARGQGYNKVLMYSFALTSLFILGVLIVYKLLPGLVIQLLYGPSFLEAEPLLVSFAFFMAEFTLASLLTSFYMSTGKTNIVILPLVASLLQIVGISLYHQNLAQVINVSIGIATLLLVSLFVYFIYAYLGNSTRLQARENHR